MMANHVPALESIVSGIKLQYHINYRHAILMHCPLCFGNENKMDWLVLSPGLGSHLLAMELRGRQNNLPKLQQKNICTHKMPPHYTSPMPILWGFGVKRRTRFCRLPRGTTSGMVAANFAVFLHVLRIVHPKNRTL
jgi:hypothetical protein